MPHTKMMNKIKVCKDMNVAADQGNGKYFSFNDYRSSTYEQVC